MIQEQLTMSNCTIDATILHNSESDKKVRYFPNLSKLIISSNITHSQVGYLAFYVTIIMYCGYNANNQASRFHRYQTNGQTYISYISPIIYYL